MLRTVLIFALTIQVAHSQSPLLGPSGALKPNYIPFEGVVPNRETAARIAEAVLIPIYGEEAAKSEEPFVVKLKSGIWNVHGRLRPGGNLYVEISKKTGCVLRIYGTE
jgi:hypothetical protein